MPDIQRFAHFTMQVDAGPDASQEEVDELTRQLYDEIQDLDVQVAPVPASSLPEGAKAGGAALIGTLAVSVLPNLIPKLADFLQSWVQRGDRRMVKLKTQLGDRSIELEYAPATMSNQDLKKLIDLLTTSIEKKP